MHDERSEPGLAGHDGHQCASGIRALTRSWCRTGDRGAVRRIERKPFDAERRGELLEHGGNSVRRVVSRRQQAHEVREGR
jgi:hypothetical protein